MKKMNIKDRIQDEETKKAYENYDTYLKELDIYTEYRAKIMNSEKINVFQLKSMFKRAGITVGSNKEMVAGFKKFISLAERARKANPEIDFKDISTQKGRKIVSDIIRESQNESEFKEVDLLDVALAENAALYTALEFYNEKKVPKEEFLEEYELTEEEFDNAQGNYEKFIKSGIIEPFNEMYKRVDGGKPPVTVAYAAAVVNDRPVNTLEGLKRIGTIESDRTLVKYCKEVEIEGISEAVKDLIRKNPKFKDDPDKEISRLENIEYEKRINHAKRLYKEADGKANVSIVSDKIATPIRVEKIITHDFKNEREKASGAER